MFSHCYSASHWVKEVHLQKLNQNLKWLCFSWWLSTGNDGTTGIMVKTLYCKKEKEKEKKEPANGGGKEGEERE